MKVAIVCDWLTNRGGAEDVVFALHQIFPDAPVYTLLYNPDRLPPKFRSLDIRTSFLQNMPFAKKKWQLYLPLMPAAVESFDLDAYDLVISSSHSVAKGVITRADAVHISYCHSPMRYAWDRYHDYTRRSNFGSLAKKIIPFMMNWIRVWDRVSADRVDHFIGNSSFIASSIKKYYGRDADVVFPPVEVETPLSIHGRDEGYYLILSRLEPQKRVDLAVEACTKLGVPLKVAGRGGQLAHLQSIAGPSVAFLGYVSEEQKWDLIAGCKAFLYPQMEDFGITAVEAQACGKPVIAYGRGGANDTVRRDVSGVFFDTQSSESLMDAISRFSTQSFDAQQIKEGVKRFAFSRFKEEILQIVEKHVNQTKTRPFENPQNILTKS